MPTDARQPFVADAMTSRRSAEVGAADSVVVSLAGSLAGVADVVGFAVGLGVRVGDGPVVEVVAAVETVGDAGIGAWPFKRSSVIKTMLRRTKLPTTTNGQWPLLILGIMEHNQVDLGNRTLAQAVG